MFNAVFEWSAARFTLEALEDDLIDWMSLEQAVGFLKQPMKTLRFGEPFWINEGSNLDLLGGLLRAVEDRVGKVSIAASYTQDRHDRNSGAYPRADG